MFILFCFVLFNFGLVWFGRVRSGVSFVLSFMFACDCFRFGCCFVVVLCRQQGKYGDLLMDEESGLARLMETFAEDGSDNDDGHEVRVCVHFCLLVKWFVLFIRRLML